MIFSLSGYDQEGAGPANDHNVTSDLTIIAGETSNSSERGSEVGNNSSASRHMQGPIAGLRRELMMKTEQTCRGRNCGGKDQEQELNHLDKPPGK